MVANAWEVALLFSKYNYFHKLKHDSEYLTDLSMNVAC